MHKISVVLFLILAGGKVFSQHPGFTLLTDSTEFRKQYIKAASEIKTIKCDFIQEKNLEMLSEKIISSGMFRFKENMVRMEYLKPFQYLLIINKNKVIVRDTEKTNTISVNSNKLFQQISRIIMDCVNGSVFSNPDFNVKIFEGKIQWMIEMKPSSKGLKEFFNAINILIDKNDYSVDSINMIEVSGDNTMVHFKNRVINETIPDETFTVH